MAARKWTKRDKARARRELAAWITQERVRTRERIAEQTRKLRAALKQRIAAKRAEVTAMLRGPKPVAKRAAKKAPKRAPKRAKKARARKTKAKRGGAARGAPALIETLAPDAQSKAILAAAARAEQFLAPDRRFIASVWAVLQRERRTNLELAAFKQLLLALQRAELLALTRLDLVGAAEQRGQRALMEQSETLRAGYGGHVTEYHLLATDR